MMDNTKQGYKHLKTETGRIPSDYNFFRVGDEGQRYKVIATRDDGREVVIGYTDDPAGGSLVKGVELHPGMHSPEVVDRGNKTKGARLYALPFYAKGMFFSFDTTIGGYVENFMLLIGCSSHDYILMDDPTWLGKVDQIETRVRVTVSGDPVTRMSCQLEIVGS